MYKRQNLFFAAVDTGSTNVGALNSAATAYGYDPANNPVRAHAQFNTFTPGGNPSTAYIVWAEGRADYNDSRPDIPVLASPEKNGVPHVFAITLPVNPLPPDPLSCVFVMHGGGDEYALFRPGVSARANMSLPLNDGIVVSPDDAFYINVQNVLGLDNTDWFGYTPDVDPFSSAPRADPAPTAVVVNYTQRRVQWILGWLLGPNSPYPLEAARVAMIGHSMGARGTSHLTRMRPDRFCAAVCYDPPGDLTIPPQPGQVNPLRGHWSMNLDTNLTYPGVGVLGITDVITATTRLSVLHRDLPLTRFYFGKRDEQGAAAWGTAQRAVLDTLNDSRMGHMVLWDEREHAIPEWSLESNDATDGHPGPWPDVGQWVAPVRTYRASAQYIVDTYRNNQSHPGFFSSDHDPLTALRQPDPGPGDPDLGDPYGTWGGYFDWDTATIIDTPTLWECTVFATGLSAYSIDNCPVAEITTDVVPRRSQAFSPAPGTTVLWTATDAATGAGRQTGISVVESDGVVVVTGLVVTRDPNRVRLSIAPAPICGSADFDGDGDTGTDLDIEAFFACLGGSCCAACGSADFDGDGDVGTDLDVEAFFRVLGGGNC